MDNQNLKIEDLEKRLVNVEEKVSQLEKIFSKTDVKADVKHLSINELVLEKKPKDDIQKALVIAYFLEKYSGLASFNVKDLIASFEQAKEKIPANINDKINKNILKGFIMEGKDKKDNLTAWLLTNSGVRFVESLPEK